MKPILILLLSAICAMAQTNEVRYPTIQTSDKTFTNAHIGTVTAAWVTILDDSGGARVAITNLPNWLQKQLGYSPEKAAAQTKSEAERKQRERLAKIEQEKYLASMATNATGVQVVTMPDAYGLCEIETSKGTLDVYLLGLPPSVSGYYSQRDSLTSQIYNLENSTVTITSTVRNSGDEAFDSQMAADSAAWQVRRDRDQQVQTLQGQLQNLEKMEVRSTTVRAYFTGIFDNGVQRWRVVK